MRFFFFYILDLDIIVAGIDNIHATPVTVFFGKSGSVEYWTLVVNRTWGTRYWRWPRRWQGFRKLRPQGKCWKSNIVFCLPRKEIVLSHLSVIWVSKKICVYCNALDLWDQVKRAKRGHLKLKRTGLQEKAQGWIEMNWCDGWFGWSKKHLMAFRFSLSVLMIVW